MYKDFSKFVISYPTLVCDDPFFTKMRILKSHKNHKNAKKKMDVMKEATRWLENEL